MSPGFGFLKKKTSDFFLDKKSNSEYNQSITGSELLKVIENENRVIKDRDIIIGLSELAPSSLNFIVRCWSNTDELNSVYWDLMAEFKKALDKNNINIPYPQIDVHLYKKK